MGRAIAHRAPGRAAVRLSGACAALALALAAPAAHAQAGLPTVPPGVPPITRGPVPGLPVTLPGQPTPGPVEPYGSGNLPGSFLNVLPPGENGFDNGAQLLQFQTTGSRPAHNNDQLGLYSGLINHLPLGAGDIAHFFKDSTFGVLGANVESSETPEAGVTIVRDRVAGVPHIYGSTRPALMFGIGYATAEDRLFFIDVLRHYGSASLASLAGGSNAATDASQFLVAPYTQQDLNNQAEYIRTRVSNGQQVYDDALNYVAGINAYINNARLDPNLMPGEYAALGQPAGPQNFQPTDLIRIASLVGGIFGQGGGNELQNATLEESLRQRFGAETCPVAGSPDGAPTRACAAVNPAVTRRRAAARRRAARRHRGAAFTARRKIRPVRRHRIRRPSRGAHRPTAAADLSGYQSFLDFARPDDPEAPTTVHNGASFAYRTVPASTAPGSLAMPDPGTVRYVNPAAPGGLTTATPGAQPLARLGRAPGSPASSSRLLGPLLSFPRANSNALLVSGAHTTSGHPIAVMGPQVAYFAPEILMEEDIHGPGIAAEGAAFPGVNLYVELGHGSDYAWSATSSGQDIIDTYAVALCNPAGGSVSPQATDYVYQGRCLPMQTISQSESWTPNPADPTPPGSQTLTAQRTALGLVFARATIGGRPVAYTHLRSTYLHELDSATGFERFNNPAAMRTPAQFMNNAYQIGYTFNWLYTNSQHIAYFNSGHNPQRPAGVNPLFPTWSTFPWAGFNPSDFSSAQTPMSQHPQVVDQNYLTSWNNKQAPGYANGDTDQEFSSIWRSQLLDAGIQSYLSRGRKMSLPDLVNVMAGAATQDLRAQEVLPYALRALGHPSDPAVAQAAATLSAWLAAGYHRTDTTGGGHYDHAAAVQIMDAWWPKLVSAVFGPALGSDLLKQVQARYPINDQPGHGVSGEHLGSAWDVGFYGVVQKDLRRALGLSVRGPLSRGYCGGGNLSACRSALTQSLHDALMVPASQLYPADSSCAAGDQACSDSIRFRPLGALSQPLIPWQNRPTFQQVLEIQGHQP